MPDWSMYELNNLVWGESDDHIVPHPGAEYGNEVAAQSCGQKVRREVATPRKNLSNKSVAKKDGIQNDEICCPNIKDWKAPMLGKGSWSRTPNTLFLDSGDTDLIKQNATYSFNDAKISNNCMKINNISSIGNELCDDGSIGNRGAPVDDNLCRFLLGDISPTESDLKSIANECEDKDRSSNLLYYGWPDIGNFEDVDRMFRSYDSTFGLGNASYDNELPWFSSSSHAIDGCEDALKSGFVSPCSEWKSTSKNGGSALESMPESFMPLITDFDKKYVLGTYKTNTQALNANDSAILGDSYGNWLDTEAEDRSVSLHREQINLQGKLSNDQHQSGKRKEQFSDYFRGDSQVFPSQAVSRQKQDIEADSLSYLNECIPNEHLKCNFSSFKNPITPTKSSITSENNIHPSHSSKGFSYASNLALPVESSAYPSPKATAMTSNEKIEKLHLHQQMQATMTTISEHEDLVVRQAQAVFTDQVPGQNQLDQVHGGIGSHSGVERINIRLPAEVDLSTAQESTCASVLSDDVLEATGFWHLQCILEQLDVGTKRCIRDSLYRLARSAEERHNFENLNRNGRDSRDRSGLLTTEETNKASEFMGIEADTNPIDRSIAHLLFHRPSDNPSSRPSSDGLPLESCTTVNSCTFSPVSPGLSLMFT